MNTPDNSELPAAPKVGYGNPPIHSRFRKGQSGNPKGRPKGTPNFGTVLARTLRERVVINENGRRKTVTKLEAAIKQISNRAASGDLKALQLLASLVRTAEEKQIRTETETVSLQEADEKVVLGILRRMEAVPKKGEDDETVIR